MLDRSKIHISQTVYATSRRNLMQAIGKDGIAFVSAAGPVPHYGQDFRQDSDFAHLTGLEEPQAVAVLAPELEAGEYVLFCRQANRESDRWEGERLSLEKAVAVHNADAAAPLAELNQRLGQLLRGRRNVYCRWDDPIAPRLLRAAGEQQLGSCGGLLDLKLVMRDLRMRKTSIELQIMRRACAITARAHRRAMRECHPGAHEYEIEAVLHHEFIRRGGRAAYRPIVAGGKNAGVLHYTRNSSRLKNDELLLVDAGAEYALYASDVTRTFPVNGSFKPAQRELYEVVLEAQLEAIAMARPGNNMGDVHQCAVRALTRGLRRMGLLSGQLGKLIKDGAHKRFYMHGTSHWLGLDVHDPGFPQINGKHRRFDAGMVITVEPGLYMPGTTEVPKELRGAGVRIEDDVLIKKRGNEVLTQTLIKDPDDIERWMAGG